MRPGERIEKKLNRLDGVTATVNFATEQARVEFDPFGGDVRSNWSPRSRRPATAPGSPTRPRLGPPNGPMPGPSMPNPLIGWSICSIG